MEGYLGKLLFIIGTYFLGAIPFGLVTARAMGAGDIRKMGSGNIGTTNVLRNTGKLGGVLTLLGDAAKGLVPVLIAESWWGMDTWTLGVAFIAVIGHNYPVYLKFKGGKGVATSLGVLIALWPYIALITIGVWLGTMAVWKYSSLAALISFALLPILLIAGERSLPYLVFSLLITLMIFFRHRDNIMRLIAGNESKIGKGSRAVLLLLFTVLIGSPGVADAGAASYAGTIPHEIQRLWEQRRDAQSVGDSENAASLLDKIVETRYELGINRLDGISALLVREGYQALEKGRAEDAYRLSSIAKEISPSYAPSYYLSGRAVLKKSNSYIMPALPEYAGGLKASTRDFWTIFNITGRLYTVFVVAVILTSLTILAVWLTRLLPILFHTFRETTSGLIDSPLNLIFFIILSILPLIFGLCWFVLFWIVLSWVYLARKEKAIALAITVFILFLPLIIKYSAIYSTAQENISLQGLMAAERGFGTIHLIEALKEQHEKEPDNTNLTLSIAYLSYKQGEINESINYYKSLLSIDNNNTRKRVLNNIGNIYYSTGDFDNAIANYRKAVKVDPDSAIPAYNLSQAYREKLMFSEAESAYDTAKRISADDVGYYTTLATKGRGYAIIDYPVMMSDMWSTALVSTGKSDTLAGNILIAAIKIPANRFPFLGISILLILSVLTYLHPRTPLAYYCPKCNRTVCGWCTGSRRFGGPCKECRRNNEEVIDVRRLDRRISFILPGIWHIHKGRVASGAIISLTFFLGLSGLLFGKMDDTWHTAYYISRWSVMSWLFLLASSYLLLIFHFKYIQIRFRT